MAREFENLEILISVLNERALENISRLIRRIERLDKIAKKVRVIPIRVEVNDRQLDVLMGKLATLQKGGSARRDAPQFADADVMAEGSRTMVLAANQHMQAAQRLKESARQLKLSALNMGLAGGKGGGPTGGATRSVRFAMEDVVNELQRLEQVRTGIRRGGLADITRKQSIFNIKQRDINNALAKFLPLLVTFKASMPAAITGVLGLASAAAGAAIALGSIMGLGVMGLIASREGTATPTMDGFQNLMGEIRDMFFDAFMPLANRLVPIMEQAMDGLGMLFEDVAQALHPILAMRGDARAFGRFVRRFVPRTLGALLTAAQELMPVFHMLVSVLEDTRIIKFLVNTFIDLFPLFVQVGRAVATLLPRIIGISKGFFEISSLLIRLLDLFLYLVTVGGHVEEGLGRFLGLFAVFTTMMAVTNALFHARLIPALAAYIQKIALKTATLLGLNKATAAYLIALHWTTASLWVKAAAVLALAAAIALATAGISLIVGALIGAGSGAAMATKELKGFNDELGRVEGQRTADRRPEFAASRESFARANGGTTVNATINVREDDTDDVDTAVNNLAWRVKK